MTDARMVYEYECEYEYEYEYFNVNANVRVNVDVNVNVNVNVNVRTDLASLGPRFARTSLRSAAALSTIRRDGLI